MRTEEEMVAVNQERENRKRCRREEILDKKEKKKNLAEGANARAKLEKSKGKGIKKGAKGERHGKR